MDTGETRESEQENENLANFIKLSKDKKFGLLLAMPAVIAALCYLLFLFLPVAQIMYYHPKSVTVLDLSDYSIGNLPLLFCSTLVVFAAYGTLVAFELLRKGKFNGAVVTAILCGIAAIICCSISSVLCDDIAEALQEAALIRTDVGAAGTFLMIGGIVGGCGNMFCGICFVLIKDGKIRMNDLTKKL